MMGSQNTNALRSSDQGNSRRFGALELIDTAESRVGTWLIRVAEKGNKQNYRTIEYGTTVKEDKDLRISD